MQVRVEENKDDIGRCGCGRSPTGKCIGWHGLNEQQQVGPRGLTPYFTSTKNLSSSDRINYLKAKTKYLSTINLAQTYANPPETNIYEKSKLVTYNGPYKLTANYNDLSVVNNYCLSQSRSYTDLLDITKGKYLLMPPLLNSTHIMKDVLQHWPLEEIYSFLDKITNINNDDKI